MMEIIAVMFLLFCAVRMTLYWFDIGFGGPVWTAIIYVSTLAWVLGAIMALNILWSLPSVITIKVG